MAESTLVISLSVVILREVILLRREMGRQNQDEGGRSIKARR